MSVDININLVDSVDGEELVDTVNSGDFVSAVSKIKLVNFVCQRVGKFCRWHQVGSSSRSCRHRVGGCCQQ